MISGSRFARVTQWQALFVLFITALLIASGIDIQKPGVPVKVPIAATYSDPDLVLYRTFITRLANGDDYYPMAAEELRDGNYPLRPFVVFRVPTLSVMSAALGMPFMHTLMWLLMITTAWAWWIRLRTPFEPTPARICATLLLIMGVTIAGRSELIVVHEIWAGLLMTLSFALHRPAQWWPAVLGGFAALMIRETALPFILLMGAFALGQRRWAETTAWALVAAIFAAVMWAHAANVLAVTTPSDPPSPGWTAFGGWHNFIAAMRFTTALRAAPGWVSTVIVPLALLGWASWRSTTGLFGFLLLAGYALILMVLGRADNFYWGLMVAPLLLLGLMFVPAAVADLRAALSTQGVAPG